MTEFASLVRGAVGLQSLASLAMYDRPSLRAANDTLWSAIAERLASEGMDAPRELSRDVDLYDVWRNPSLLLAQTCGYPLTTTLKDAVRIVATPRYLAPGCAGAFHRSAIVVGGRSGVQELEALRGARCVINSRDSNTGMNLLRAKIAPLSREGRFFGEVQVSGSHAASLAAVAAERADVAAIDAVTLALIARDEPDLVSAVRIVGWTRACPGLPLVTAATTTAAGVLALRRALNAVAADPQLAATRSALLLDGFTVLSAAQYRQVACLERQAVERGYPELA
ncbi:PhnD/SsuA/transferrin family substrate-binding protein [Phenylobacterium sp.]|uniref:phosphate/phosphite/phosphonate ABC transporter substrate-binding protein n=1 Tax=Phenylobacterium sp. TaxID=1871053 RepID=UPI00289ED3D0|nr:PhnD/SsuA/transferrin family substrate-binding protein [Phenylobacterium sp.]